LAIVVQGVPAEFIINMDESGCADSLDPRKKKVVIPVMDSDGTYGTKLWNCSQWNRAEATDDHFEEKQSQLSYIKKNVSFR
jgi:hypothetical protein